MSIRTIRCSFGPLHYAVCNECGKESDRALTAGVAHSDESLNVAFPAGWTHEQRRTVGGSAWAKVQVDFCPACSVAPEYR